MSLVSLSSADSGSFYGGIPLGGFTYHQSRHGGYLYFLKFIDGGHVTFQILPFYL